MVARSRYGRQRTNPITITMMAALRGFEPRLPAPQAGVISDYTIRPNRPQFKWALMIGWVVGGGRSTLGERKVKVVPK